VDEYKGQILQLNQSVAHGNRLTIRQFISFTLVMAGTLFGALVWISSSLREENRLTREQVQQQIQQLQRQIEQSERNLTSRFEDLRQIVLSQQKQPDGKKR
jgi:di/tricarboxylate transporter